MSAKDSLQAIDSLPYRLGVGIALFNAKDHVFVGQRIDNPGPAWQMPQGGIDSDEEPLAAAWREMKEEIGTTQAELIGECPEWLRYDLPLELVPKIWNGRYRGQKQKWFAFRFLGQESDIHIDGTHAEFSAWQWVPLETIPAFIVPFKQELYQSLVKELKTLLATAKA